MKPINSLKKIVVSGSRIKLLQVLFNQPGEMFYIRQLTRLTDEKLNSVRRELENLKDSGILEAEPRANKIFYWTNTKHIFFEEILSLVIKTSGLGHELIKNRQRLGSVKFIMFSGRFARVLKKPEKAEGVDILVIGRVVLPELTALIKKEEDKRDVEINYTVMTEDDFSFRKKNRDPFLLQILSGSRIMVLGDQQNFVDF